MVIEIKSFHYTFRLKQNRLFLITPQIKRNAFSLDLSNIVPFKSHNLHKIWFD